MLFRIINNLYQLKINIITHNRGQKIKIKQLL